jgi:hypothetical protein
MLAKVAARTARGANKAVQEAYNRGHEHGAMGGSMIVMAMGSFGVLAGLILAEWARQSKR